jgi:hypothetical protein
MVSTAIVAVEMTVSRGNSHVQLSERSKLSEFILIGRGFCLYGKKELIIPASLS